MNKFSIHLFEVNAFSAYSATLLLSFDKWLVNRCILLSTQCTIRKCVFVDKCSYPCSFSLWLLRSYRFELSRLFFVFEWYTIHKWQLWPRDHLMIWCSVFITDSIQKLSFFRRNKYISTSNIGLWLRNGSHIPISTNWNWNWIQITAYNSQMFPSNSRRRKTREEQIK